MTTVASSDREIRAFIESARRATLATIGPNGLPRLVPICFVLAPGRPPDALVLVSPLDEKPKTVDDARARVRDIEARPRATLLVDRWSEDWSELAWVRLECAASVLEPEASDERNAWLEALRAKHPQYLEHGLESR